MKKLVAISFFLNMVTIFFCLLVIYWLPFTIFFFLCCWLLNPILFIPSFYLLFFIHFSSFSFSIPFHHFYPFFFSSLLFLIKKFIPFSLFFLCFPLSSNQKYKNKSVLYYTPFIEGRTGALS